MANIFGTTNPFYSQNNDMPIEERIAILQQKNNMQNQNVQNEQQIKGRFGQLNDYVKNSPQSNMMWTSQQKEVQNKASIMMDVFMGEFLFENAKVQFEEWCNNTGRQCINEYVDTFVETSKFYVDPASEQDKKIQFQEQEIAQLKAIVSELANKKVGDKL